MIESEKVIIPKGKFKFEFQFAPLKDMAFMAVLSDSKKRGCPTCDGLDPKSCMRCKGKTRMCDWRRTDDGWAHLKTKPIGDE